MEKYCSKKYVTANVAVVIPRTKYEQTVIALLECYVFPTIISAMTMLWHVFLSL